MSNNDGEDEAEILPSQQHTEEEEVDGDDELSLVLEHESMDASLEDDSDDDDDDELVVENEMEMQQQPQQEEEDDDELGDDEDDDAALDEENAQLEALLTEEEFLLWKRGEFDCKLGSDTESLIEITSMRSYQSFEMESKVESTMVLPTSDKPQLNNSLVNVPLQ